MIRNRFKQIDRENNDYRLVISNENLHALCGTRDVTDFIKSQQASYVAHVIRMPNGRSLKQSIFNDDTYRKRGRPFKTLLDQDKDVFIDVFCRSSNERV